MVSKMVRNAAGSKLIVPLSLKLPQAESRSPTNLISHSVLEFMTIEIAYTLAYVACSALSIQLSMIVTILTITHLHLIWKMHILNHDVFV